MYVITFYSFKGGVGRTMALVNVAAELVRRGRKVLVVDFDLEAPGLETYKHLRPQKPHPGVVEYVSEFRRSREVPNLLDYVYETKPIGKKGGRLWVMPAGRRDKAYRNDLANLDWQRLYRDEQGFLLFEDTKEGWKEELKPDYVLIDSRTGDTDVMGICTRQLPDSVVLMFAPNEQNLAGLEGVCRDIRREETEGLKKKIRLHFVAANVPDLDDETGILRRHLQAFRDRLDFRDLSGVIRRYENLSLLDQSVFTIDRPHSRLARSYRRLTCALLKDNLLDRDGAMIFLQDYPKEMETRHSKIPPQESRLIITHQRLGEDAEVGGLIGSLVAEDKSRLHVIARYFNQDVDILHKVADCFIREEGFKSAIEILDRVLKVEPNRANTLNTLLQLVGCKLNLGDIEGAAADLLTHLRLPLPEGSEFDRMVFKGGPLRKLRDIAPEKLFDVADMLENEELLGVDPIIVAWYLSDTDTGALRAARLLRRKGMEVPIEILLKARCWTEVIQMQEYERREEASPRSLFGVALAHWGKDGELPESLCKQILEMLEGDDEPLRTWGSQAVPLLGWRLGDVAGAIDFLSRAEQVARAMADDFCSDTQREDKFFSVWRMQEVSLAQYLDDCRLLRRMIQGKAIRPVFLGEPGTLDANDAK